ncbi:TrmH family RNA methyltransferase [Arcanobacterium hippocoleae]
MPEVPALSQLLQESKLLVFALRSADPGNLGTIIRAADAFGAQGVVIGAGSVEVTNPKVIRASVGSLFHLPVVAAPDATDFVALARSSGFQVCAAHGRADYYLDELAMRASNGSGTCDLRAEQIDLRKPTIWMLGNEAHGFSEQELALADSAVAIRMSGRAESLNVAMAASICLYTSAQAQLLASHLE